MMWYVWLGGRLVGWVVASSHGNALAHARTKYPPWDFESHRVAPRNRKRVAQEPGR